MNRTNDSLRIARNIREVRVANNLTQLEMAETLGYTERTIRRLETSGTDNISVINLIASKFNVSAMNILFN
jgi:transcriptional regulator with XRE-family HTH domain